MNTNTHMHLGTIEISGMNELRLGTVTSYNIACSHWHWVLNRGIRGLHLHGLHTRASNHGERDRLMSPNAAYQRAALVHSAVSVIAFQIV